MAAMDRHREDYTDGDDCRESYLAIQTPVDSGTVQYKLQNATYSLQTVRDENLSPRIDERHLLHSVVFVYASTG